MPTLLAAAAVALLAVAPEARADKAWREARKADTSAAWGLYASAHPTEPRAALARHRAERRGWDEAVAANTSASYTAYVAAFPSGQDVAEARTRAETLGWDEAVAEDTIGALTSYIGRYPRSPHVGEATQRIEELWYGQCKLEGTEAGWARYLSRYPLGKHAVEAQAERDRLAWAATTAAATRYAYRQYLERFPTGLHITEARGWLDQTYVRTLQPVVALFATYQAPGARPALLARIQGELDRGLLDDLKETFTVLPTRAIDATAGGLPNPNETIGARPDTGILVLEYSEYPGRRFDPAGVATDIAAILRLYTPNTPNPVWSRELSATTPEKVHGTNLSALQAAALQDLSEQLTALNIELAQQRAQEGT